MKNVAVIPHCLDCLERGRQVMLKILFEFIGGPNDGEVLQGMLGDASDADRHYLFTNHGTVGQRFKVASQYAVDALAEPSPHDETPYRFQRHYYVVTGCLEGKSEVWVRSEYVPQSMHEQSSETSPDQPHS